MTTDSPVTVADRDETLRSIVDATAAAVSANPANAAVVFRAAGSGGSGVATDIRIGRAADWTCVARAIPPAAIRGGPTLPRARFILQPHTSENRADQ
jgi:hypothetical protein